MPIDKDELVVAFCHPSTAEEMGLPDDVSIATSLIPKDEIIVVSKAEFLNWLYEKSK